MSVAKVGEVSLSLREVQVLQLTADGMTTAQAAEATGLSTHTIKTHKSRVIKKLSAANFAHAVAIGFRSKVLL